MTLYHSDYAKMPRKLGICNNTDLTFELVYENNTYKLHLHLSSVENPDFGLKLTLTDINMQDLQWMIDELKACKVSYEAC